MQTLVVPVVLGTVHAGIARSMVAWTLFQVIKTCINYRKQCFLDPVGILGKVNPSVVVVCGADLETLV